MKKPIQAGDIPEILHPALRQYRHNTGGDELIHGFDLETTIAIVKQLQSQTPLTLVELTVGAEVTLYGLPYTVDEVRDDDVVMSTMAGNTVCLAPEVAQGLINDGDLTRRQS